MIRPGTTKSNKIRKIFFSIRGKILILCICLVSIPVFVLGIFSYQVFKKQAYNQTIEELKDIAGNWETIIYKQIENISIVLSREEILVQQRLKTINNAVKIMIGNYADTPSDTMEVLKGLNNIRISKNGYMTIFDRDGFLYLTRSGINPGGNIYNKNQYQTDFISKILLQENTLINGDIIILKHLWQEDESGNPRKVLSAVSFYKPLELFICVHIYESDYKSIKYEDRVKRDLRFMMADQEIGKKGYLFAINTDGEYVVSKDNLRDGENIIDDLTSDGRKIMHEIIDKNIVSGGGYFLDFNFTWSDIITGKYYKRIAVTKYIPEWNWIIGASMFHDDFLNILTVLKKYIAYLVVISVVAGSFFAILLSNLLTSPILKLDEVMRKASIGDFETEVDEVIVRSNDEISSLADTFSSMMKKLKERRESLNEEKVLLSTLIDSSPDPTYFQDTEGYYLNCNKSFEKLIKIKKMYLLGKKDSSFLPHNVIESFISLNRKSLSDGKLAVKEIYIENGKILETVTNPFYDREGMLQGVIGVSRDITERVEIEKALRESEKKFRQIIENASDIIFTMTVDGIILEMSKSWSSHLGYDTDKIKGKHFRGFVHHDDAEKAEEILKEFYKNNKATLDYRVYTKSGLMKWHTCNATLIKDGNDKPLYIIGVSRDITEMKKHFEKIQSEAELDSLTGIYNRRMLDNFIESEIAKANHYKSKFVILMIDLDYFKRVNDNYGHDKGDEVLKTSTSIFKANIRQSDIIARYGGEEFVIIAKNTDVERGIILGDKIRKALEEYDFCLSDPVTASIGVSQYTENDSIELLLKKADNALYRAKNNGRNRTEAN